MQGAAHRCPCVKSKERGRHQDTCNFKLSGVFFFVPYFLFSGFSGCLGTHAPGPVA